MRGFIAIELDNETMQYLSDVQKMLKESGVKGNYSRLENLHITVKFLGELDPIMLQKMCALIKKVAKEHQTFVLTLNSIGNFNKGNKSIFWAGLVKSEPLFKVQGEVEDQLETIMPGIREKTYSPHITLVREAVAPADFYKSPVKDTRMVHTFTATGLSLMESTRVDGRLTYIRKAFEPFK